MHFYFPKWWINFCYCLEDIFRELIKNLKNYSPLIYKEQHIKDTSVPWELRLTETTGTFLQPQQPILGFFLDNKIKIIKHL